MSAMRTANQGFGRYRTGATFAHTIKATLNQPVVCIDSGANSGRFIVSEALRLDFRSTRVLRLGLRPAFPHYGRTCAINRLRER